MTGESGRLQLGRWQSQQHQQLIISTCWLPLPLGRACTQAAGCPATTRLLCGRVPACRLAHAPRTMLARHRELSLLPLRGSRSPAAPRRDCQLGGRLARRLAYTRPRGPPSPAASASLVQARCCRARSISHASARRRHCTYAGLAPSARELPQRPLAATGEGTRAPQARTCGQSPVQLHSRSVQSQGAAQTGALL